MTEQIHEIIYAEEGERMFPFITSTCNPVAGGPCPYGCSYCWASDLKRRYGWSKYKGEWRLLEKELRCYDPDEFVFVQDMGDIGAPDMPEAIVDRVTGWMVDNYPADFLLLTKNPRFYLKYKNMLPRNAVLGATVETDRSTAGVSKAPHPYSRLTALQKLSNRIRNRLFISIEPIMQFTPKLLAWIRDIRPWAVAVGMDNYGNGLPEPTLEETRQLIQSLSEFTTVYVKTLREAHR